MESNREGAVENMHHSHSASEVWTDTCEMPRMNKFPFFQLFQSDN
jgi:hypothetical protein